MKFIFPINLRSFDNGWLCIDSPNDFRSVRIVLDKPIPVSRSMLSMFNVSTPSCIVALSFSRDSKHVSVQGNYIDFDNLKIYVRKCSTSSRFAYWSPVDLCISYESSSDSFNIYDFFRVLRPCIVRRIFLSKISSISISCVDDYDRDSVLKLLKFRYEIPIVKSLPDMFLRDVHSYVNDFYVVKCIEDYLFSVGASLDKCARLLMKRGIINRSGMFTKLGVVLCLVLAPFIVDEDMLEILKI